MIILPDKEMIGLGSRRYNNLDSIRTFAAVGIILMHVQPNIGFKVRDDNKLCCDLYFNDSRSAPVCVSICRDISCIAGRNKSEGNKARRAI